MTQNNLPTAEVKTHIVVFFDSSKFWITEKQKNALAARWGEPDFRQFKLNGSLYSVGNISKILTQEEYYEQYPDERPIAGLPTLREIENRNLTQADLLSEASKVFSDPKRLIKDSRHAQAMLSGFDKGVSEMTANPSEQTLELRAKIVKGLKK